MHTQCERKLATVVQIVLDDVPDDPLARTLLIVSCQKGLAKVCSRPAAQAILHQVPGSIKSTDKLGCFSGGGTFVIPSVESLHIRPALLHYPVEPSGAGCDDMTGELANRAQRRRGT